jgi:hypothetical protein
VRREEAGTPHGKMRAFFMSKKKRKPRRVRCHSCGKLFPRKEIIRGPDPFDSEIYGDDTVVNLCDSCHEQSAADI